MLDVGRGAHRARDRREDSKTGKELETSTVRWKAWLYLKVGWAGRPPAVFLAIHCEAAHSKLQMCVKGEKEAVLIPRVK